MKRILVVLLCIMLILVGCGKKAESSKYKVTLDINPSIELEIEGNKVNIINMLSSDADAVINRDFEGKTIEEVVNEIVKNAVEKNLVDNNELMVIIGTEEGTSSDDRMTVEDYLMKACDKNDIRANIIVPEITEEARHEAEGYGVTPAKAAVILQAIEGKEDLHFDDLKDKSARELSDIIHTGLYCRGGFTLRGDFCEGKVKEEEPKNGKTCPEGFMEYKGACYEEAPLDETEKLVCTNGSTLKGEECVRTVSIAATPSKYTCSKGTAKTRAEAGLTGHNAGDAKDIVCEDTSKATHPVSPCELNDGTEWTKLGGKCYWHRAPVIDTGCPGKIKVDGFCWDDASNVLICKGARDGKQYKSRNDYCEGSVKYTNPTVSEYKCDSGYKLDGKKCTKEESSPAEHERACPDGFKLVNNDKCIDMNNQSEKVDGFYCDKNARLEDNKCVYYEVEEALGK